MRIVYFGSGDFAVPSLQALAASGQEIALVVTQPDRPAGRGGRLRATPVCEAARALELPVVQPETLREGEEEIASLRALAADLGVVVAYGLKIPPFLLALPAQGMVNAHASLLPKYRGAAPVPHAILAGETETGVTVFQLSPDWDAGPVYATSRIPIRADDTAGSLLERLSLLAAELLVKTVASIESGAARPMPQDAASATRAPKLRREDGRLDWSQPYERIDRKVRAFQPWPEAFTTLTLEQGDPLRIHILRLEREPAWDAAAAEARPGALLLADGRQGLVVATGGGAARLALLKPAGRSPMTGAEFARGRALSPNTILGAD